MKFYLIMFLITILLGCTTSNIRRGKLSEAFDKADNPDSSSRYVEDSRIVEREKSPWKSTEKDDFYREKKWEDDWKKDKYKQKHRRESKETSEREFKVSTVVLKKTLDFESGFGYHFLEFNKYIETLHIKQVYHLQETPESTVFNNYFQLFPYIEDERIYRKLNSGLNGMYPIVTIEEYVFSKSFKKPKKAGKVKTGRKEIKNYNSFTFGANLSSQIALHEDYISGFTGCLSLGVIHNSWVFNVKLGPYFLLPDTNLKQVTANDFFTGATFGFDVRKRFIEISKNMEISLLLETSYSEIVFDFKNPVSSNVVDSNGNIIEEHIIETDRIGIFSIGIGSGFSYCTKDNLCITISPVIGYSLLAPYTVERFDNDVFKSFPYLKLIVDISFIMD